MDKTDDLVWNRVKRAATADGERGYVVSMADARITVLNICVEENTWPLPSRLEYFASEFVRLNEEARDQRDSSPHFATRTS